MASFILLLDYLRPLAEVDAQIPAHRAFLKIHYDAGTFLLSGRQEPRTGGVIVAQAPSRQAIEAITQQDPFFVSGVARYTVIEFVPTLSAEPFSFLVA